KSFEKQGIIVPQFTGNEMRTLLKGKNLNLKYFQPNTGNQYVWDKNVMFFPRKISGKLAFLHRIRPGIQIAYATDLNDLTNDFWIRYRSEEHTSELQSRENLVCRLLLEKKKRHQTPQHR